jgi:hypothetical protein
VHGNAQLISLHASVTSRHVTSRHVTSRHVTSRLPAPRSARTRARSVPSNHDAAALVNSHQFMKTHCLMSTCVRRSSCMDGWRENDDNDQMCAERRTAHSLKRRDNAWASSSRLHRKAFTWVAQDTRVCSKHTRNNARTNAFGQAPKVAF